MGPIDRLASRTARIARAVSLLGAFISTATCGDQTTTAPRAIEPGHARFSVAPRFAKGADGGPVIQLETVTGVLTDAAGNKTTVTAHFKNGVAILDFDVQFTGSSADFKLEISTFDANGVLQYQATQEITLKPGNNTNVPEPVLVYAAPDKAVTAIKVSPGSMVMNAGGSGSVSASGTNSAGQPVVPLAVGWTARNAAIATVDAGGGIHAGNFQGSTYVVAKTFTGIADSAKITVHAPVAKVTLTPASAQIIRGLTTTGVAQLFDVANNLIDDRTATFTSSDPTIASVAVTGVVTGVKVGTATITAAAEGKTAAMVVTVLSPLARLELTPATANLASLHQTLALTTNLVPKQGASVNGITPTYKSSDPTIVSVDASGVVTANKNGTATITVTAEDQTATSTITVKQVTATVTVVPKTQGVSAIGAQAVFTATAIDALGSLIDNPAFAWTSSDPTVASVNGGAATALKTGSSAITASLDGKSDFGTFIVSPAVKLLLVYSTKSSIQVGSTATLSAKTGDANGNPIADVGATYSTTTPGIISVSGTIVTGLAAGTGHVVATAGSLTGGVDIKVTAAAGGGGGGLVLNVTSVEKLPRGTHYFNVVSGGIGPYTWNVNGIPGGNATFGTVSFGEGGSSEVLYRAPNAVPSPATFDVCALQATPPAQGCVHVTISPIPSGGADLIVINDMNLMQNGYISAGNRQMFKNIAAFTPVGSRASATKVMFEYGHESECFIGGECGPSENSQLRSDLATVGITGIIDDESEVLSAIPPDVKVLYLMTPVLYFSISEVNVLKSFAAEGGRIVFIGENPGYYGEGIPVENQLLVDLGAQLTNSSNYASCGGWTIDAAYIQTHQITTGVTSLQVPCATEIILGPNDYAIAFNTLYTGEFVPVIAVAKIDVTPIIYAPGAKGARAVRHVLPARGARKPAVTDATGLGPARSKPPGRP